MTGGRITVVPVTEREFQRAVLDLARLSGWRCHWAWTSVHSPKGWPDLTCARAGRLIFAELKGERGRVTKEQLDWLAELGAVPGVEAHVWRPADWPAIEAALR